ncbi:MAG: hypothetical protein IJJ33_04090 [Victivallales bacterium]|nr:hypothetical protein [Victivallales bacterium]
MKLHFVNIAPLFDNHVEEVAEDLLKLSQAGDYDETAFKFTLVPEGTPPYDKARILGKAFMKYRDALKAHGLKAGILLQATMGHGWIPDSRAPYQNFRRADLKYQYTICPLDKGFQAYLHDTVAHLASLQPDFMMVDDDFRMLTGRNGCFCPLHIAAFNQLTGREYTAESLTETLQNDCALQKQFDDFQRDTLKVLAKIIRQAIDAHNPAMPCTFCACAADLHHAPAIAETLAAPGQEIVVRINNGRYLRNNPADFGDWLFATCTQRLALPAAYSVLTEADTCPQNRYSTDSAVMHANITLALLQGYAGAKLWVTRLSDYEPSSGIAYRRTLATYAGMYQAIRDLNATWRGFSVPIPMPTRPQADERLNWGAAVFSRMGLPFRYSHPDGGPSMLAGHSVSLFSDPQLLEILKGNVILDGLAGDAIAKRGFASLVGYDAITKPENKVSCEEFNTPDGASHVITGSPFANVFEHIHPDAEILSNFYHKGWMLAQERQALGPGVLRFRNRLGGTVVTFGAYIVDFSLSAFFLLNETRKLQLRMILKDFQELPLYYDGDQRVILQKGDSASGEVFYVCNCSNDILEDIPLAGTHLPASLQMLTPEGTWENVPVMRTPQGLRVAQQLLPLHPIVFRYSEA